MKKSLRVVALTAGALIATSGIAALPAHAAGATKINVWAMQGQTGEVNAAKQEVAAFNKSQKAVQVTLKFVPDMGTALKTTAAANLPDAFEFDGETQAALVYNNKLAQLDKLFPASFFKNELASIQAENTNADKHIYAVSQYDSGLTLWGNKSMLKDAGITDVPTSIKTAWTADRFTAVLKALAAKSATGKALDIKENYGIGGGWAGYAFSPIVNSAGYQLVANGKAQGNMDAPAVAAAFKTFASWKPYVDPSADDSAFTKKRVALAWVGHWAAPAIKSALGADAELIPLPDFGMGTKSGQGSHSWAIGAKSKNAAAAAKFLQFITQDAWINNLTNQNGAVPATKSALAASADYADGGLLALYKQQLSLSCGSGKITKACVTVPRTISPAWPVINTQFSQAVQAIYDGADPQTALTKAAKAIDQDYADNNGYKK
jgi:multiple sugar transport system substrate-binding protein